MALATSGNLSLSQSVISTFTEGYENPETGARESRHLRRPVPGRAAHRPHLSAVQLTRSCRTYRGYGSTRPSRSAGRSRAERLRLFAIYAAGNFIEWPIDTPYLQVGSTNGKLGSDRAITSTPSQPTRQGRACLHGSTMRSDLASGCGSTSWWRREPATPS
jgi:putative proteasome-type protease